MHDSHTPTDPAAYWEGRYATAPMWSGRVNRTLAEVVEPFAPGTALDLGCGEGADALWLAERGWRVTAVDIAPSAIARATDAARAAGWDDDRARFVVVDLDEPGALEAEAPGPFDLVTASFLHSPVELNRVAALRRAAALVAPGGRLVVLSHAAPPPWASGLDHAGHRFSNPEDDLEALDLGPDWTVELAEVRKRAAAAPDGTPAHLLDGVIVARRGSAR
jgi:SAM-dependent methyltransferase